MHPLRAQGATEYLVLLAVVLIIALVSIALLGFFPGMAQDSQMTENQIYWRGASPLQIETSNAYAHRDGPTLTIIHMKIKNTGNYPIRLSKIIGAGTPASQFYDIAYATHNMNEIYIAPGETACFGANVYSCPEHYIVFYPTGGAAYVGANGQCDTSGRGTLLVKNLGFEYTIYVDGQPITKTQIGKDLMVKCVGICPGNC